MSNRTQNIPYGDGVILGELPERTRLIRNNTPSLPPLSNLAQAVRNALDSPIAHEPLHKLVNSKSKVTIAFDDLIGHFPKEKKPCFREVAVKVLLEELDKLGVDSHNIRLVSAVGLHRKWTRGELATVLGNDLVNHSGPSWLFNHDAEDKDNMVFLGETHRHHEVEVSRLVTESDQLIYVSHPFCQFNGGWKTVVVGLGTWRTQRHHHRPFPTASVRSSLDPKRSAFFKLINEMGTVIEKELARKGRRVLVLEGTSNNALPQETVQVVAGHPPEAHAKGLEVLDQQLVVDVKGQCDVVVAGMGNSRDPYSYMSISNPITVRNLALSYTYGLFHNVPLVKPGGILIVCHPCQRQFDSNRYPSYVELFEEILPKTEDAVEIWDLYAEDFANRTEYIHKHRHAFAFHGTHPLILYGQGIYGLKHLSKVFLAGATDFEAARRVGFEPFATVEEAIAEAEDLMGNYCSIDYLDMSGLFFICNVSTVPC